MRVRHFFSEYEAALADVGFAWLGQALGSAEPLALSF
jgi:hypothetical protein